MKIKEKRRMKKRIVSCLLIAVMAISMCACSTESKLVENEKAETKKDDDR